LRPIANRALDFNGAFQGASARVSFLQLEKYMTLTADEYNQLRRLEESLWRAETRFNRNHMNQVLAPDFLEFGRSGRVYAREDVLDVPPQPINATLAEFTVRSIAPNVALLTYLSELTYDEVKEVANRSSLWSRHSGAWRIRFHQGTPA
jgi:hypothetical protein